MTLTISPVSSNQQQLSRVALLVTNLLGDEKARWYSDSVTEAFNKASDLVSWPDTVVYVFDTDNTGEMSGVHRARIDRTGYHPNPPVPGTLDGLGVEIR